MDHALGTGSARTVDGERGGSSSSAANTDDPAKRQQDSETCTADGTISDFLEQQGTEILNRTFAIVGGAGQIGLGVGICGSAVGCAAGAVLGAHGASNVYEGMTGSESLLRDAYRSVLGSAGNLAYSSVDISSSVYGLTRRMLRPGNWSLFRNISSDYIPAFKAMTGVELISEGAGLISTVAGAAGLTASRCQP